MTTGRSHLRSSEVGLRSQLGAGLGSGELSDCLLSLLGDRDGGEEGGTRRGFDVRSFPPASSQVATLNTRNSPCTIASKDLPASVARTWLMRKSPKEDRPRRPPRPLSLVSLEPKWLRLFLSTTILTLMKGTCIIVHHVKNIAKRQVHQI